MEQFWDLVVAAIRKMTREDLAEVLSIEIDKNHADPSDVIDVTDDDGSRFSISMVHVTLTRHP